MNRSVLTRTALVGVAIAALTIAGCSSGDTNGPGPGGSTDELASLSGTLDASGASFPNAYYQAALDAFSDVAPNLEIQYRSTGSGTGKKEFASGLTDFAGSDSLVNTDDPDQPAEGTFLYVPTVAAPITVSYHLPEVADLQLSGTTVGSIFARTITTWNDPAIAEDNPGVDLPDKDIAVVHRSDGSGTTNNFTSYLEKAGGDDWTLGRGDSVAWAADTLAGDKNTGVAAQVKQTDGAIGYVDLADAAAAGLVFASIKNKAGNYVAPSLDGTTAGLAGAEVNDDLTYDPLDAQGADAYPITAPTYILVKPEYDAETGPLVIGFLKWLLTDGRAYAEANNFAVLPDSLQEKALAQLDSVVITS